jgi:hypothetical protein
MMIFIKIKEIMEKINPLEFNELLKNYNYVDQQIVKKSDINGDYHYIRNIIYTSKLFDIILIDWMERSSTRIHDHPDKGCIVKILDGILLEETYLNNLSLIKFEYLKKNNIGYKISNKILHKLTCQKKALSLHIYIPGQYKANYY